MQIPFTDKNVLSPPLPSLSKLFFQRLKQWCYLRVLCTVTVLWDFSTNF